MMGQPQQRMGDSLVPINNNQEQSAPRKPGSAVGVRNFLVGTPANNERFGKVEAANDQEFGADSNISYVPGSMPVDKKYDTTGAIDVSFKEEPQLRTTGEHPGVVVGDPVQIRETTGEHPGIMIGDPVQVKEGVTDPERAKEALGKLEKVKANRGGFLKGLRERMGVAQEKMEAVAAKVGKAVEAYNNLPPKTKLAIGLTLTAGSMIGVASGATFLAGGIGLLRFAMKRVAVTTPSTIPSVSDSPVYGFDAASAPPVGSIEVGGDDGTLAGYKLPDGSFMDLDGKITPEAGVAQAATVTPETVTPNKFDLGVEESFVNREGGAALATSPEATTPTTNMVLEDGTPVQSGASTLETPVRTAPEAGFVEADATLAENKAVTSAPSTQVSFAPNPSLSPDDMSKLSSFTQLTSTDKFNSALTTAATDIDKAKSFFSLGDGSGKIKESFLSVVQKNPSISVNSLLTADASGLSGKEGNMLREAQGVLKRMIPEDVLAQNSVRESSVVSVLQNNFTA